MLVLRMLFAFSAMLFVDHEKPTFEQCFEDANLVLKAEFIRIEVIRNKCQLEALAKHNPYPEGLEFKLGVFKVRSRLKGEYNAKTIAIPILVKIPGGTGPPGNVEYDFPLLRRKVEIRTSELVASLHCNYLLCIKHLTGVDQIENYCGLKYLLVSTGIHQQRSAELTLPLP